ncbi:hypothetical protein [Ornithinimicrobium kibberense]
MVGRPLPGPLPSHLLLGLAAPDDTVGQTARHLAGVPGQPGGPGDSLAH